MNILVVSRGFPSKKYPLNGIFERDQALALKNAGHKVLFAAVDIRSIRRWRKWGYVFFEENGIEICEINIPVGAISAKLKNFVAQRAFHSLYCRIIKKYGKVDIVYAHFGDTASCVVETCRVEKIPYVVMEHSSKVNRDSLSTKQIESMRYVYQNASAVLSVSKALSQRLEANFKIKPIIVPNIVSIPTVSLAHKSNVPFRFISAANLNSGKGFCILLTAFHKCVCNGMNAELLIMGDGPEFRKLKSLSKAYGLTDCVKFYGKYLRFQFVQELSQSDAFVLASRSETFGLVYVEAMACGLPVIATRCGGPEDFVNETNGLLVDVDDVDGLANALQLIYNSIDSYDSYCISKNVKDKFSEEHIAKEITNIFMNILSKEIL